MFVCCYYPLYTLMLTHTHLPCCCHKHPYGLKTWKLGCIHLLSTKQNSHIHFRTLPLFLTICCMWFLTTIISSATYLKLPIDHISGHDMRRPPTISYNRFIFKSYHNVYAFSAFFLCGSSIFMLPWPSKLSEYCTIAFETLGSQFWGNIFVLILSNFVPIIPPLMSTKVTMGLARIYVSTAW